MCGLPGRGPTVALSLLGGVGSRIFARAGPGPECDPGAYPTGGESDWGVRGARGPHGGVGLKGGWKVARSAWGVLLSDMGGPGVPCGPPAGSGAEPQVLLNAQRFR